SFVKEFGEHIFTSDGKVLFCKLCEVKVSATKRFLVTQHIKTAKHEHVFNQRKRREQSTSQSLFTENTNKKSDFNSDLTEA
ncbi:protein ALP1-like, partial [Aphis craccivora]